jgi:DNA-binding transcriptional ArsR family regulator
MVKNWRNVVDSEIEKFFIALSDETRRKMLKVLDNGEEHNVTEIASHFKNLSRSNISHHLGIMKRAGIFKVRKAGKENYYYIHKEHFIKVLKKYIDDLEDRCC